MGRSAAHTPSASVIERERQVLELRRAGVTFDVIADQLKFANRGSAYKAYKRALARTLQEPAAEVRELEIDRLERLHYAAWAKAMRGDLGAIDRVLRISERRARLLGLDAPVRAEVKHTDALDAEIEDLMADLAARGEAATTPPAEG